MIAVLTLSCGGNSPPPLVILIVFDALRADRLSQYDYPLDTSPGLAFLASRATVFRNAYAPSSYTTASTASIFTGQSPLRHGTLLQGARLREEHVTLTELLAQSGYHTRGISFNPVVSSETGFSQGFRDFLQRESGSPFNVYPDIEQGIEHLRSWLGEETRQPSYLYFQPMNTHGPYFVPREHVAALYGRPPLATFRYYDQPMAAILTGDIERRAEVTPEYLRSMNERYDTAVRYSTDRIGAFFEELERSGRFDEALIVVSADHGDELFEHGGFSHGYTLKEEVIRVPLIVKLPGQKRPALVTRRVSIMDIYPSVAQVVGAIPPHDIDGASLLHLIEGREDAVSGPAPALTLVADFLPRLKARGVIAGNHKLVAVEHSYDGAGRRVELHDLAQDPREELDRFAREPTLARELLSRLADDLAGFEAEALPDAEIAAGLDLEHLRALGYAR